ncbi:flavin reductase [Ruicaihuangia caeni]|uniref:Flavin reductase n=1 Tax=Ruicaihuangia caeni TaxID=3042517 RepID=A0AAW6TA21_9MICO|nr:flavin reductase [Klugiella sp. YN-L-19]MDI2099229.1 flavin reductase [Klugiella sp. YN-L-19]
MKTQQLDAIPAPAHGLNPNDFRRVLGHYPTGVCVVTAMDPDEGPVGMTIGSFNSVSLEPPLVSFMPIKTSSTFARIRRAGSFCVNVLSADQGDVCRRLARRDAERFNGIPWRLSPAMAPVIDGSLAWIDCRIDAVHEAGDHYIVLGEVTAMDTADNPGAPLLFFQGGYGRFSTLTLTAVADDELSGSLLLADAARPYIEQLASKFEVECHATGVVGDHLIQVAYSGAMRPGGDVSKVGLRLPFLPPMGAVFVAWAGEREFDAWLDRAGVEIDDSTRTTLSSMLADIRRQGWVGTPADDRFKAVERTVHDMARAGQLPALERALKTVLAEIATTAVPARETAGAKVHSLSAPVFNRDGRVVLALTLNWLGETAPITPEHLEALLTAAAEVTRTIGGATPADYAPTIP